jgi:hypothetical protein
LIELGEDLIIDCDQVELRDLECFLKWCAIYYIW